MCMTIIEYECRHVERQYKPCRSYLKRVHRQEQKKGFWKSLFSSRAPVGCIEPFGRRAIYSKCDNCLVKEASKKWQAEQSIRRREERVAQANKPVVQIREQTQRSRLEHDILNECRKLKKLVYSCQACTSENRYVDERQRAANEGLCCARGIDEFEAMEKQKETSGYANNKKAVHSRNNHTEIPRVAVRGTLPQAKDENTVKEDARTAADRYGWKYHRNSAELEPELVKAYINTSGIDPGALPPPKHEARPLYESLHLDEDRWNRSEQTAHGRLPPRPDKPLPPLPFQTHKIARKPLPTPVMGSLPRPTISSHSHSSRGQSSRVSPAKPVPRLQDRKIISELGNDIDDELESWSDLVSPVLP
jgi:hypothetical protein